MTLTSETRAPVGARELKAALQDDGFLELLSEAIGTSGRHIQGFLYGEHHVIRDVSRPWGQQEIWRRHQSGEDQYEACHEAMMHRIKVERLRCAIDRTFARLSNPWPGQEDAAEKARAALAKLTFRLLPANEIQNEGAAV